MSSYCSWSWARSWANGSVSRRSSTWIANFWYARSEEIVRGPIMETLMWLRVPGDVVFAAGAMLLAWAVFTAWRQSRDAEAVTASPTPVRDDVAEEPTG